MLQNLLASHDIVAQRDYMPKLSDIPIEVDEDEETIKIVQLVKSSDPTVNIFHRMLNNCRSSACNCLINDTESFKILTTVGVVDRLLD